MQAGAHAALLQVSLLGQIVCGVVGAAVPRYQTAV